MHAPASATTTSGSTRTCQMKRSSCAPSKTTAGSRPAPCRPTRCVDSSSSEDSTAAGLSSWAATGPFVVAGRRPTSIPCGTPTCVTGRRCSSAVAKSLDPTRTGDEVARAFPPSVEVSATSTTCALLAAWHTPFILPIPSRDELERLLLAQQSRNEVVDLLERRASDAGASGDTEQQLEALRRLAQTGGRERTEADHRRLLDGAWLELVRVASAGGSMAVLEARKR